MNLSISRAAAIALLAMTTWTLYANGQAVSNPGPNQDQKKNQQNNQANPNDKGAKDSAALGQPRDMRQGGPNASNAPNQPNQNNAAPANRNAAPQQNPTQPGAQNQPMPPNPPSQLNQPGAANQQGMSPQQGQNQSGANQNNSSRRDLDRFLNQNNRGQSSENREARRETTTPRERTAYRPTNMRAPDIGIWFNRANRDGLVIADVSTRGPIARFGFREGDRIVSVNGRRVASESEFIDFLLNSNAYRVEVIVVRDGREETIFVEPAVLTEEYSYVEAEPIEQFGVVLDDRYDDRIVVWKVIPRSPAYYAGIREGDVITTLGGRPFTTRTEFERGIGELRSGETNLQVRRGERTRDLSVDVPEFERSAQGGERSGARSENRSNENRAEQSSRDQGNRDRGGDQRQDNRNPPNMSGPAGGAAPGAGGGERRENR
jgi:PDZ domain